MSERKRYVLAGTGVRGLGMYARPLLETFTEHCELVGLFDHDALRMRGANQLLNADLPTYTDFDRMLAAAAPDAVIITTTDATHAEYVMRTLEAGKRAISEKPLCINAQQVREILDAAQCTASSGALGMVTHNLRYFPAMIEIKRLLDDGAVGEILSINYHETLDRRHGADYFRRWHRHKANSGGLLLQKSSHHFDALNWLVGSLPDTLVAQGGLAYYGKNGPFRSERCTGCAHAARCDLYADLWTSERNRRLYRDAESDTGYIRDRCVFGEDIDIYDQMSVLYIYQNGVQVTYHLIAYASYESETIQIEGTQGRIEYRHIHDTTWSPGGVFVGKLADDWASEHLTWFNPRVGMQHVPIPKVTGSHGGADAGILHDFFARPFDAPPTERQASLWEAAQAVLIGDAANISIANDSRVLRIQELLKV